MDEQCSDLPEHVKPTIQEKVEKKKDGKWHRPVVIETVMGNLGYKKENEKTGSVQVGTEMGEVLEIRGSVHSCSPQKNAEASELEYHASDIAELKCSLEEIEKERDCLLEKNQLLQDMTLKLQKDAISQEHEIQELRKNLELAKIEIKHNKLRKEELHERVKSLEVKAHTEVQTVMVKITALENEKEQLRQKLNDANADLEKTRSKIKETQNIAQIAEKKYKFFQSEKGKKEEQFLEYEQKYKQAEEELKMFKESHYHFQEDLKEKDAEIEYTKQQLQKKLKDAQEDLHAARSQAVIYEEELKKTMTDLKKEKDANAQLQNVLERDQRVINGLKEEKNSLKAVKISYEEIRDAQKNWEEEKKGSEQLIRAYKRQVDSLNDQFKLKQQELQATLDKMKGVESKNNELHSKCLELKMRIATQERTNTRYSDECEKCGNWGKEKQRTDGEMMQLRCANQMLQQRLRSVWDDIKHQQQSHLLQIQQLHKYYQSNPQHPQSHNVVVPVQSSSGEVHSRGTPAVVAMTPSQSHVSVDERSKQADIALQKADEARQELEAKFRTQSQLVGKYPMYQSHSGMVQGHNSKKNQFEETAIEIEENLLLHGIDNEIQNFADHARKQTIYKPPSTQELDEVVPVQSSSDEVHSRGTPAVVAITPSQSHVSVDERSKQADIALQKADEARQELEAKRRTQFQLVGKYPMYQSHSGMVQGHNSKKNQFEETAIEIEENLLLHGIDNEIQNFADHARKQTIYKPPSTQELDEVVPVQSSSDEVHSRGTPAVVAITPSQSHVSVDERSKQADIALQKADEARQDLEAKRRTQFQLVGKYPMYQSHSGMVQGHNSKKNQFEETAVEIEENLFHGIDEEILIVADQVRKQSKPPSTQELDEDDASLHIPFDPNLQCQGCGMLFHVGEIQKLKRHINEFCRAPIAHRI